MSVRVTPGSNRPGASGDRDAIDTEARLRKLVEIYRRADSEVSAPDSDLRQLVEEDQARRLLASWKNHLARLRKEISAINAALEETGVRLAATAMEPGAGVSYLACVEVCIEGDPRPPCPSAFVALTRRAEARLQIRMPGCHRHETRYVALAELAGETWKSLLLDLLEANRAWQRLPR